MNNWKKYCLYDFVNFLEDVYNINFLNSLSTDTEKIKEAINNFIAGLFYDYQDNLDIPNQPTLQETENFLKEIYL